MKLEQNVRSYSQPRAVKAHVEEFTPIETAQ